ncbi:MAG: glycoside hydrolase N-terminal domain-containing protein [Pirellulales bacterium]|nr:glycoside hydrolase N-terminal domain-containing protein [Pirellulales bacterium]
MRCTLVLILTALGMLTPTFAGAVTLGKARPVTDNETRIWFDYPAKDWHSQALHLGNGYFGASFYGGVGEERFDFTDKTAWLGGPGQNPNYRYGIKPGGKEHVEAVQKAIVDREFAKADRLVREHFSGDYRDFGSFTSLGRLFLTFDHGGRPVADYVRQLDLANSLAQVSYTLDGVRYTREYFCSYPDRLLVIRISADRPGQVSFTLRTEMIQKQHHVAVKGGRVDIQGRFDGNGREFSVKLRTQPHGGSLSSDGSSIRVSKADDVVLLMTMATEYRPEPPTYAGADPEKITSERLEHAVKRTYGQLKTTHVQDYRNLFDRVRLSLDGGSPGASTPSNVRLERLKQGHDDPALITLLFNYGRYLIISASRPGAPPSNLFGTWASKPQMHWQGNYQSNINLQEMYWSCGVTNLPECHRAYLDWIRVLVRPGREVAKAYYGANGWVSHGTGNIWGYASPGFGLSWGMYPVGAAWHCHHLWEQYAFTQDKTYLRREAYPVMKEAAEFWLSEGRLVPYEGGLISAPTVSAEHGADYRDGKFIDPTSNNEQRPIDAQRFFSLPGAYQDLEMIHDLFTNVMEAAEVLQIDREFRDRVARKRTALLPMRIGRLGQLQEWALDIDSPRDQHRHISHLWAVYPGRQIHPLTTPKLAAAAAKSLNLRGDGRMPGWFFSGGNWARAWRVGCWARLLDGDRANKILTDMFREQGFENLMTFQHVGRGGRMLQVDGSMATPGLIAEMLLQSHLGELHLLPAIPSQWPRGSIRGLVARGGYRVDLEWDDGRLQRAVITGAGEMPKIRIQGKEADLKKDARITYIALP